MLTLFVTKKPSKIGLSSLPEISMSAFITPWKLSNKTLEYFSAILLFILLIFNLKSMDLFFK